MAGIFDGAFGGGGTGILPDWLWQNPQPMAEMPNAMAGGSPAGSFDDRWSGVAALPPMQSVAESPLSIADMFRGGADPYRGVSLPQPARVPHQSLNAGDEGGGPLPPAASQPAAPAPGNLPPSFGLPVPKDLSSLNLPSGNPFAGAGELMSSVGDWINNNRNMLAAFGAGIAGGGGTGSWNAGMSDALRGMASGGQIDAQQRQQQAAQKAGLQYISNATDIDPQLKAAMRANPALAAQYLSARAKPPRTGKYDIPDDLRAKSGLK